MRMRLFYLILLLAVALPAVSQEEEAPDEAPGSTTDSEAAIDETDAGEAEEEIDDSDLDTQTYEEPEDVFIPTEEIPSDEPIPFPSNI
jgi:hypothetical protein